MARAATGYVDPNFPSPGGPNDASIIIFGYRPSLIFPIIAIVTFAIMAAVHTYQAAKHKTKYFSMVILACILEIVGYSFRTVAHYDPYDVRWFVVNYFMLVTSPVLYSAAIYGCLSSLICGRWLLATFVTIDVVTTIMQIAGAAGIGSAESNGQDPTTFNDILIAGLTCQTFGFLVFLTLLCYFINLHDDDSQVRKKSPFRTTHKSATRTQLFLLLAASLLIFARTVFRLGEAADGVLGPASSNEILFAMLDYFPVIVAVMLLSVGHPGHYRNDADS